MEKKKTQSDWSNDYRQKAYDSITALVRKGDKARIAARAKEKGYKTVSGYINDLIYADMGEPCPIEIKKEEN